MSKALERREKQRGELILAAERAIAQKGLAGLTTRDLAREIGCANGAVYNLVEDVDELILRVGSRTLCPRAAGPPPRPGGGARGRGRRYCFAPRSPFAFSPPKPSGSGARCSSPAWSAASRFRN